MMLHVICGYPSKSQGTYDDWGKSEFNAYAFVRAVKGKDFNGYADIKQGGKTYRLENNAGGRAAARGIAGRSIAAFIAKRLELEAAAVVPVPSSDHLQYGNEFAGSRLALAIQAAHPPFQAYPNVVFDQIMQKASEGGPRDPAVLLPHLRLEHELPQLPVVLVDDVSSTHGHVKATARLLRGLGVEIAGACCVAQTVWERPAQMFAIEPKELCIDTWPGDHPGLFD